MAKPALGRRRGTRRGSSGGRTMLLIGLVGLLVLAALLLGMLLGTHVLGTSSTTTTGAGSVPGRVRGAASAGVHTIMHSKTMEELNSLVRAHDQKRIDPNDDEKAAADNAADIIHPHDDDDKIKQDADNEGDESPSAKPQTARAAGTEPYPYSLDPAPLSIDFKTFSPTGGKRFVEYTSGTTPWVITDAMRTKSDEQARSRRAHVKAAMQHAWKGYTDYAFGSDEVLPQTKGANNNWGNMGTTLVDSLDTLWLMGMKDEFYKARDWCRDSLTFDNARSVSVFETTIRSLGGLLAAYDWSHDAVFLEKAKDLGARLFHAFDNSNSDIPYGQVNLQTGKSNNVGWTGSKVIISEAGTLQIEYRYLARMTGKTEYAKKAEKVFDVFNKMNPPHGLYPYFINDKVNPPTFANNKLTFGAMTDSLYEYMLKIWLQGGKKEQMYRDMYDRSIQGMHDELLQTSTPSGLMYIADKNNGQMDHKMDHLVCFMGGLLALGAYTDPLGVESERAQRDLTTAKALTYTCYQMYARMETGISADFVQFHDGADFAIGRGAPHYLLRPEAFESFFILSYLTGDPAYREWGWECFQAIERYCKTDIAYGALHDVGQPHLKPENKMESFFLAETLKYLFLLQDPDTEVDIINKHVFNTEAHPLRMFPVLDSEST